MKLKTYVLIACIAMLMPTCTYEVYNPDISFQKNILPIFVTNCAMNGCHNSSSDKEQGSGYDFSNYEGIMKGVTAYHPHQSEVYSVISGINPSMPVGGKLSQLDISYIKIWIKMGAKNSSETVSTCDTSKFSYATEIKPIITTWCNGCHSPSNLSGSIDLSTYSGLAATAANKKLMGSIKQLPGYIAMPQGNKLSDCDIKIIEKWVNAGYLNN